MMSLRPRRIKHLHQPLERNILVAERPQIDLTNPTQQLRERLRRIHLRPQHQRIDEHPDQIIKLRLAPPSDRRAHHNVITTTQPRQHHRQRRMHHHEQRHTTIKRQLLERPMQPHINRELVTSTTIGRNQRPRTIRRQLDPLRQPLQHRRPIPQLLRHQRRRITLGPQHLTLPQRVIRILHLERRPPRNLSTRTRHIRHRHITHQRPHRHTISSNMVNHQRQHKLRRTRLEQTNPQRHLRSDIKPLSHHRRQHTQQISLIGRHRRNIHSEPTHRKNLLEPDPLELRIHRPQNLMPRNNIRHSSTQRRNIHHTRQTQHNRNIVHTRHSIKPRQKPHPLLRQRQRHPLRTHPSRQRHTSTPSGSCERRGKRRHGRRLEQRLDLYPHVEDSTQPCYQLRCDKRIASKLEEVVIRSDLLQPEQFTKHRGDLDFILSGRNTEWTRLEMRLRQRGSIQLAHGCQRNFTDENDRGRHHMPRQFLSADVEQFRDVYLSCRSWQHVCHQSLLPIVELASEGCNEVDRPMGCKNCVDLSELDSEASDLHLGVGSPDVFEVPCTPICDDPAYEVTTAVHSFALRSKRIRDETVGSHTRQIVISARNLRPGKIQLTCRPDWDWL